MIIIRYTEIVMSVEGNILVFLHSLIEGRILQVAEEQQRDEEDSNVVEKLLTAIDNDIMIENMDNYARVSLSQPETIEFLNPWPCNPRLEVLILFFPDRDP